MEKGITGRITLNLIAGIVITVVTVVVGIFWMAARQNDQAAQSTETMVAGGVDAIARRAQSLANDYGWWPDAYTAYVNHDDAWFETNFGSSVEETEIADVFAILSTKGTIDYSWVLGDELGVTDVLTPNVIAAIHDLTKDMPVESLAARSAFVRVGSQVMVIAVSRITPDPNADPATLPLFVAGLTLTDKRLGELGKTFLIDDLRYEPAASSPPAGFTSIPAVDIFGDTIGYYVWTPPTPGYVALVNVLPPIAIALALFCVVAFGTAFRARRIAIALTESEKEAVIAARTDSMTSLMNRTGFNELLEFERL